MSGDHGKHNISFKILEVLCTVRVLQGFLSSSAYLHVVYNLASLATTLAPCQSGRNAMHVAAKCGNLAVVKLLRRDWPFLTAAKAGPNALVVTWCMYSYAWHVGQTFFLQVWHMQRLQRFHCFINFINDCHQPSD